MDYTTKELLEIKNYKEICDCFLSLAPNNKTKHKLLRILFKGKYKNNTFNTKMCNEDNVIIEAYRRICLANLLINNPNTFEYICENNINLFHGTNSINLPSILNQGLISEKEAKERGINIITGEQKTEIERDFISFTDILDIAKNYSEIKIPNENELSFSTVIGTSKEELLTTNNCEVFSEVVEVGVMKEFPKDKIKAIFVPNNKLEIIKQILPPNNMNFLPINNKQDNFYSTDYFIDNLEVSYEKVSKLKEKYNKIKNKIRRK